MKFKASQLDHETVAQKLMKKHEGMTREQAYERAARVIAKRQRQIVSQPDVVQKVERARDLVALRAEAGAPVIDTNAIFQERKDALLAQGKSLDEAIIEATAHARAEGQRLMKKSAKQIAKARAKREAEEAARNAEIANQAAPARGTGPAPVIDNVDWNAEMRSLVDELEAEGLDPIAAREEAWREIAVRWREWSAQRDEAAAQRSRTQYQPQGKPLQAPAAAYAPPPSQMRQPATGSRVVLELEPGVSVDDALKYRTGFRMRKVEDPRDVEMRERIAKSVRRGVSLEEAVIAAWNKSRMGGQQ